MGFYSIFVVGGTKNRIWKCGFLAFFGAKMATIDIQNLKLIIPNDYQLFYIWSYFDFDLKILIFQLLKGVVKKTYNF